MKELHPIRLQFDSEVLFQRNITGHNTMCTGAVPHSVGGIDLPQ